MKSLALLPLFLSMTAFAGTTCPTSTKAEYTCTANEGLQFDFCKKKDSKYQIRINGEVYSQDAEKTMFDGLVQFQGTSYEQVRFIAELDGKKSSISEVDKYEMPIGDAVALSCAKQKP